MGSLSKCLKKMGLSEHEGAILRGAAEYYRNEDGLAAQEAAVQAVNDYIEQLQGERADIVRQIEEAGGQMAKAEAPAAPAEEADLEERKEKLLTRVRNIPHIAAEYRAKVADKTQKLAAIEAKVKAGDAINWGREWEADTRVRSIAEAKADLEYLRGRLEAAEKAVNETLPTLQAELAQLKTTAPEPEGLSETDMRAEWDRAAAENGLPPFEQLTEEQQNFILGSTTNEEFNEAANEVAQELMGGEITPEAAQDAERFSEKDAPTNPTNAATLASKLKNMFFSNQRFDQLVMVHETQEQAQASGQLSQGYKGRAQAFVRNRRVHLIAENIEQGEELAVFLHELGVHMGLRNLIGAQNMSDLAATIAKWAKRNDGSRESTLAKAAQERAKRATSWTEGLELMDDFAGIAYFDKDGSRRSPWFDRNDEAREWLSDRRVDDRREELIAYFVEEAVRAGINPTAAPHTEFGQWFRKLWAAAKAALRKIGLRNPDKLSAQNVVDLAMGAARLEMAGAYHGTAAVYRKVDGSKAYSGEGAQVYGAGALYAAQRRGVAESYRKDDVRRKRTGRKSNTLEVLNRLYEQVRRGERNGVFTRKVMAEGTPEVFVEVGEITPWGSKRDLEYLANYLEDYQIEEIEVDGERVRLRGENSPGALMRVDYAAREEEYLDWDKPLSEQGQRGKRLLELLNLDDDSGLVGGSFRDYIVDQTNEDPENLTGGEMHRLLKRAIEDGYEFVPKDFKGPDPANQEVSALFEWAGFKGIQFLDQQSRNSKPTVRDIPVLRSLAGKYMYHGVPVTITPDAQVISRNSGIFVDVKGKGLGIGDSTFAHLDELYPYLPEEATEFAPQLLTPEQELEAVFAIRKFKGGTRNLVLFNDKDIVRVVTKLGDDSFDNRPVKFSERAARLPRAKNAAWTNIKDWAMKVGPMMLTNFQIAEQFGAKLASLRKYVDVQQEMNSKRLALAAAAHRVVTQWENLHKDTKPVLNQLMLDATLAGVHPDVGMNDPSNAHLNAQQKIKYAALASRYRALPEEAKKVYQAAKAQMEANWKARQAAWESMVNYTYNSKIEKATKAGDTERAAQLTKDRDKAISKHAEQIKGLKGPYFPLMRFGEHLAIGESAELRRLKDQLEEEGTNAKLSDKIDEMEKDPKHYIVSAHESRAAAEGAVAAYKAQGLEPRYKLSAPFEQKLRPASLSTVTEFADTVRQHLGGKIGDEVGKLMYDVYLRYSPENSALAREAERRGIAGASADMLRAFSAASERDSYYLSRLEYSPQLTDTLFAMRKESDKADLGRVYNEMAARAALDVTYSRTPIQGALSTLSWAWHLGASPSFLLINSTQPWLITVPVLGAKFGVTRAMNAMRLASVDALSLLKDARIAGGKVDWWSDIKTDAKRPDGSSVLTPGEQAMVKTLVQRGVLDVGMEHDLSTVAHDEHKGLAKAQQVLGWATQQVELVNRFSSALASYRLAISRGMTVEQATQYAYETTSKTQLDYNEANAARVMRQGGPVPLAKLVFQFRKYQQGMLYLLGSNIKAAVKGDKQAMAALGYLFLSQGMIAGTLGLPFMGTALALANLFFDDDDEKGDAETRLRNFLAEMFGKDAGLVLAKGLPTLLGIDISKRAGMGDIASPFPYARFDANKGQDLVGQVAGAAAGPVGGVFAQWVDSLKAFSDGDFQKGVEKATPKMVADLARGYRFANDGLTDSKGRYIFRDDQFSTWDVLLRGAGFSPVKESEYYTGMESKMEVEDAIKERRQKLIDQWVKERLRGEPSDKLQAQIDAFNEAHNRSGELGKIQRSTLLRALQTAKKSETERVDGGIRYRKAERGLEGLTGYLQ